MYPSLQRLKLMKENSAGLIIQQFHTRIYRKMHLVPEIILNISGHNELRFCFVCGCFLLRPPHPLTLTLTHSDKAN